MQFYVDIEDANGNKLGSGPITSASSWRVTARMDGAGGWEFTAPLADVKLAQATPRRYAHIYARVNDQYAWIGGGPIDSIRTAVGADGVVTATVAGDDMLRELTWRSVGALTISDGAGSPLTHSQAVAAVAAFAPAGWTITADGTPGNNSVYGQFNGETVLAALMTVAERSQSHIVLTGRRALAFMSTVTDSGVYAVAANDDLAAGACAIIELKRDAASYDLVSRIVPVGAGQSLTALTLRATTRTAPGGYTLSATDNYIRNDAVETEYGHSERVVHFKDIAPLSSTTADLQSASNMLFDAALAWLDDHSAPVESYQLSVAECPTLVRPLQSVRLIFDDPAQNISINETLVVLAVEWSGDDGGVRTAGLTVATAAQWPDSDTAAIVGALADGKIYQAHPQVNTTHYVIPYSEPIDEDEEAEFWWRFDDHIMQLVRVYFDFEIRPLESTVKTIGASSVTSTSDGSHTHSVTLANHTHDVTLAAHTHSVTIGNHTHTVTLNNHAHDVSIPAHTHSVTIGNHTHSVTLNNHAHDVSIPAHTHSVTIGNHTHSVTLSDHNHEVPITADPEPTGNHPFARIVYYDVTDDNFYFQAAYGTGAVVGTSGGGGTTATSSGGGGTTVTSASGGSATVTSSSGGGTTATSSSGGGTTVTSASGGSATVTSSSGGGTTATSSSGGGSTVTSSAGGGTTVTSSGGGGTTATSASGGSHSHTVTPTITTTYGIYREATANTFALNDLEYSLDGTIWYAFVPSVNGYTSLGDNRHRIDLTALLQDGMTLRPVRANNMLRIRRKATGATGKTALIKAQLGVLPTVQALALI